MTGVRLLVGTRKGAFVLEAGPDRRRWRVRGPLFGGEVFCVHASSHDPDRLYAAVWSPWSEVVLQRSSDGGRTWEVFNNVFGYEGPTTAHQGFSGDPTPWQFKRVWRLASTPPAWGPEVVFAGVEDAALFRLSEEDGWSEMQGLRCHPTHERWMPGAGGLCLHTVLFDPTRPGRVYAAISAAGVFRSDDGGHTWKAANKGLSAKYLPEEQPEAGYCVHKVAMHPERPHVLFMQKHYGVYRSDDAGESWRAIDAGLPSDFGFPVVVHAHEPDTVYVVPITSDEQHYPPAGALRVWRSRDGGETWAPLTRGLPDRRCYVNVLRDALATDQLDPCGVYLGTTGGQLFASADAGESWRAIASYLPPVLSVEAVTLP
jgi:photosystem II stability/assembly factor-like uncharacterized protein